MTQPRRQLLLGLLLLIICISVGVQRLQTPLLIWNTTPSVAKGLYRIQSGYQSGDLVAFDIPDSILPLVRERGWIPDYDRLLKRIVGGAGDQVCLRNNAVYINQQFAGERSKTDSKGRPMPQLSGCTILTENQVWVMLKDNPLSLDSRYFGAVDTATIYGKAVPVFTY